MKRNGILGKVASVIVGFEVYDSIKLMILDSVSLQ